MPPRLPATPNQVRQRYVWCRAPEPCLFFVTRYDKQMTKPYETRGRPRTGRALSAAERMRRYRARQKAAGLKTVARWVPRADARALPPFSLHRVLEARSLALHCLIARRIMADPSLIAVARHNVDAWRRRAAGAEPGYLDEWRRILALPPPQLAALITEQSENAVRLRQSSPFAGVLTAAERKRIYDAFRA